VETVLTPLFRPSTHTVVGRIQRHQAVQTTGKWAESLYNQQQHAFYPPWPQGSCGYLVSRAVAEYIAKEKGRLETMYQGEDTSLGIWLENASAAVHWVHSPFFVNHGDCRLPRRPASSNSTGKGTVLGSNNVPLVIGHRMTPELMRRCYEDGDDEWNTTMRERFFYLETHSQRMNRDDVDKPVEDAYYDEVFPKEGIERHRGKLQNQERDAQAKQRAAERAKKRHQLQQQRQQQQQRERTR